MADRPDIITWLASDGGHAALAGALGGVVRWLTLQHSWREGFTTLIVGAICAIYIGPLALPIMEQTLGKIVPNGDMAGLTSFLTGIGGISLSGMVIDVFQRRRAEIAKGGEDEK